MTTLASTAAAPSSTAPAAPKTALITGIIGQDGSWLAEFLHEKGHLCMRGDPAKAKKDLGWVPEITLDDRVARDLQQAKQHALLKSNGYNVNVSVE